MLIIAPKSSILQGMNVLCSPSINTKINNLLLLPIDLSSSQLWSPMSVVKVIDPS